MDVSNGDLERSSGEITKLLKRLNLRDEGDQRRLFEKAYGELRALARRALAAESPGHTLTPTALVHEAYLEFCNGVPPRFGNQGEFYAYCAAVIRHTLVDYARAKKAMKRGGEIERVSLDHVYGEASTPKERSCGLGLPNVLILDLDVALTALEKMSPRQSRIVELHFFTGLPFPEIAATLGVASSTVFLDWRIARAFLRSKLAAK